MNKSYLINLNVYSDDRGNLISMENQKNVPFEIKRVFYIYGVPNCNIERGKHKNIKTKHILIALKGHCEVDCLFENHTRTYVLNSPSLALYIDNDVSKRMYNFSKDAILLCLCSELYDVSEYEL